jgi:hypothetical protein
MALERAVRELGGIFRLSCIDDSAWVEEPQSGNWDQSGDDLPVFHGSIRAVELEPRNFEVAPCPERNSGTLVRRPAVTNLEFVVVDVVRCRK